MLLEELSQTLQLQYLSDLRASANASLLLNWLSAAQDSAYPAEEWRNLMEYLMHEPARCYTIEEVRGKLTLFLTQRRDEA